MRYFFQNNSGFIAQVTQKFALTFDGEPTKIGNLTLHLSEHFISQAIRLPQIGERWFKKKPIDEKAWLPFINKSRKAHKWANGISRSWLSKHWDELTFLIHKYIASEGMFLSNFLYHIKIHQHLSRIYKNLPCHIIS